MIKNVITYVSIAGLIGASVLVYSLYSKNVKIRADRDTMQNHYEAQIEILKHPKEKIDQDKEVMRIVYVDKKGDEVVIEKEIVRTSIKREPVVLKQPVTKLARWYVSGSYGSTIQGHKKYGWGAGAGCWITESLAVGLRYDIIGKNPRIAVETTIRF